MTSDLRREDLAPSQRRPSRAAVDAGLSITAVARQTGISPATLRVWQVRYGLGPGLATPPGRHRRYTVGDIQRLRRVKHLVSEGLTTSEAVHAVLAAARSDLGLPPTVDPVAHHLGAAALELDGPTARRLIDEHLGRGDVATTWETVLRPVLSAIGDRWMQLSHAIAVENLLSHIAVELLSGYSEFPRADDTTTAHTPKVHTPTVATHGVVLACVPGELHDLPLVVLDAALRSVGIIATRLAAPTSDATLGEAVTRHPRPVIALHAIVPESADPAIFDRYPAYTTLLALGPGWHPEQLPGHVMHINALAAAREHIALLVSARLDTSAP